jgi:hypothetical protein
MKMFLIATLAVFITGFCAMAIADAVGTVERAAAERDAEEAVKAEKRLRFRDGTLFKNSTTVSKSLARVRRSALR